MRLLSVFFALSLTSIATHASTVIGNPTSSVVLVDDADVYVDRIVAVECGSNVQHDVDIDQSLQQWESASFALDVDDYCALTAHVRWTAAGQIEAVSVSGFDTFAVEQGAAIVEIQLDAGAETAALVE